MRTRLVGGLMLAGLVLSPAMADVVVSFEPVDQEVALADGQTTVEVWADIAGPVGVIAFGFDIDVLAGASVAFDSFAVAAPWDSIPTPDGDGIAGVMMPPEVGLGNVLLGTATFDLLALGLTELGMSDDFPSDLVEGFFLVTGGVASVTYGTGTINVVPEPAGLALLVLGAVLRRR